MTEKISGRTERELKKVIKVMIHEIENYKQLNEIIIDRRIPSISDNVLIDWYHRLFGRIELLHRRYKSFVVGSINRYVILSLFLLLLLILTEELLKFIGFKGGSFFYSVTYIIVIWGGVILLFLYLHEYNDFVTDILEREKRLHETRTDLLFDYSRRIIRRVLQTKFVSIL